MSLASSLPAQLPHPPPPGPVAMPGRGAIALLTSLLAHALLLGQLPRLDAEHAPAPAPIRVSIVPPPTPPALRREPLRSPPTLPAEPAPPRTAPQPAMPPKPARVERRSPSPPPPPAPAAEAPLPAPPPAQAPQSTAPAPPAPQPQAPPAMPPVAAPPPSSADRADALARYAAELSGLLAARQRYPRLAALRGWEGNAELALRIGPDGELLDAALRRSSGHPVLDDAALELVRSSAPFPPLPPPFRSSGLEVGVPVSFRLEQR